jgi:hypothetical protein
MGVTNRDQWPFFHHWQLLQCLQLLRLLWDPLETKPGMVLHLSRSTTGSTAPSADGNLCAATAHCWVDINDASASLERVEFDKEMERWSSQLSRRCLSADAAVPLQRRHELLRRHAHAAGDGDGWHDSTARVPILPCPSCVRAQRARTLVAASTRRASKSPAPSSCYRERESMEPARPRRRRHSRRYRSSPPRRRTWLDLGFLDLIGELNR